MSRPPPPPLSRPTVQGAPHPNAGPGSAPPPHVAPPTPGQHGFSQPLQQQQQYQQQQNMPSQGGASNSYAPSPSGTGAPPPRLVGSASMATNNINNSQQNPNPTTSHPAVPAIQRRPSPVRAGNSPTASQGNNPNPPTTRPMAPTSNPIPMNANANSSSAQYQQGPPPPSSSSSANGALPPPSVPALRKFTPPAPTQTNSSSAPPPAAVTTKNPPQFLGASSSSGSFARPIPTAANSPPKGPNSDPAPFSASPSRTMSAAPSTSNNVAPSPPANNNNNQQQQKSPPRMAVPLNAMNFANNIMRTHNNNTTSPPRTNNNNDDSATAPSPIPMMMNAALGAMGGGSGSSPTNARNVSWAMDQYNKYQQQQQQSRQQDNNNNSVSHYSRGRTLPPPVNDTTNNTSVIRDNIDTVGLHRLDIQDAINSSHYAVSGSQFPLAVVPQSKSKTRGITSTVPGCITVEILVMINGAHGSGYNSKCDEVRIVNVDPARTTIRRLINLAHKAVNFVPVTRGVLQMSARALANRRVHNLDKPLVTPIPLPDQVVSITEMITLSEEDFVDCIPLRENDVLCWVEADPVALSHELKRPTSNEYQQQQQDMHLIGSPNRSYLASTRLPRAVHQEIDVPRRFDLPERVIDVPMASTAIEFENMSPSRGLRKEPGNGTASLAHRQISGRIGAGGVSTPSWRLDNLGLSSSSSSQQQQQQQQQRSSPPRESLYNNMNNNNNLTSTANSTNYSYIASGTRDTNTSPSRSNVYAPVPHSSVSAYVNSSLRNNNNNNTVASSSSVNNSPLASKSRQRQQQQQQPAPISLANGEVIYPRSEEERRLVEEIRAIRRDIETNRY